MLFDRPTLQKIIFFSLLTLHTPCLQGAGEKNSPSTQNPQPFLQSLGKGLEAGGAGGEFQPLAGKIGESIRQAVEGHLKSVDSLVESSARLGTELTGKILKSVGEGLANPGNDFKGLNTLGEKISRDVNGSVAQYLQKNLNPEKIQRLSQDLTKNLLQSMGSVFQEQSLTFKSTGGFAASLTQSIFTAVGEGFKKGGSDLSTLSNLGETIEKRVEESLKPLENLGEKISENVEKSLSQSLKGIDSLGGDSPAPRNKTELQKIHQEKIARLQANHQEKIANLKGSLTGDDATAALAELEKEFQEELKELQLEQAEELQEFQTPQP